jgi:hypothetical protein
VPFYDINTEMHNHKMIIPWCIDGNVSKFKGEVKFSFRFFITNQEIIKVEETDEEGNVVIKDEPKYNLVYNLTATEARSRVLEGMEVSKLESDFNIDTTAVDYLLTLINGIKREGVYWDILD